MFSTLRKTLHFLRGDSCLCVCKGRGFQERRCSQAQNVGSNPNPKKPNPKNHKVPRPSQTHPGPSKGCRPGQRIEITSLHAMLGVTVDTVQKERWMRNKTCERKRESLYERSDDDAQSGSGGWKPNANIAKEQTVVAFPPQDWMDMHSSPVLICMSFENVNLACVSFISRLKYAVVSS